MPENTDISERVVDLVSNSSRFARLASSLADDDRPKALIRALSLLDEYGELRISEIARIDRCSQPSATELVKKLHTLELVERAPDPTDSRASLVSISDRGRDWLAESRAAIGAALAPLFADVEPEQISRISAGLHALRDVLKETTGKKSS